MKIEELDNSKKKSKLLEKARTTTRPAAFFKPKIRIPKPRIQKPKITDIETNWDFKPEIAPLPGITPNIPPSPAPATITSPAFAHELGKYKAPELKPIELPAYVPGKIPDWTPDGIEQPELKQPEFNPPERPELKGSGTGARPTNIDAPVIPPILPPLKEPKPYAYPTPTVKDPTFTTRPVPELPGIDIDPEKLDLPGDKVELDIPTPVPPESKPELPPESKPELPVGGRRPERYVDPIAGPFHGPYPGEKDFEPLEPADQPGGEDPWPLKDKPGAMGKGEKHNVPVYDGPLPPKVKDQAELAPIESYADLSDKAKKVFWRVLKPGVVPNADMLKVHPHEWDGPIITVTKADGDQIQKTEPSKLTPDSSTLAPVNPEKGVDARDFWEGLGYSSLAQFEKAQKDAGGGKIGYAKGKTTGKQVPVVYPKQAYISKQAIDAGLTIGPKGELVTSPKIVPTGKDGKKAKSEPFNLDGLSFAKNSSMDLNTNTAGGTKIINVPIPALSAETRIQMKDQLDKIIMAPTKEQKKVVADIEKNLKDLTPKDKNAITVHMKSTIENYIKPNDQDLYHFGKNLHLTGTEITTYAGAGVLGAVALAYLLPAAVVVKVLGGLSTAARIALANTANLMRSGKLLRFATQSLK